MKAVKLFCLLTFFLFVIVSCNLEKNDTELQFANIQDVDYGHDYLQILTKIDSDNWKYEEGKVLKGQISQSEYSALMASKEPIQNRIPTKLHPVLQLKLTEEFDPEEKLTVIINYEDYLTIPSFYHLDPSESKSAPKNKFVAEANDKLVEQVIEQRESQYEKIKKDLEALGAEITNEFWLINAVVAILPAKTIFQILEDKTVLFVEPDIDGSEPPQSFISDGRNRIRSDPYFGFSFGHIGLLDSGVRSSHTSLTGRLRNVYDCTWRVFGIFGPYCGTNGNPQDSNNCSSAGHGHGTATASIMSGTTNLGTNHRGVSSIRIDSYRVYSHGSCGLDTAAALAGFQKAISDGNNIIVAEIAASGNYNSSLSVAADNAFDAGRVVIAANGNNGSATETVNVPAAAHKAIGVGALFVTTLNLPNYQSRGPTDDGRVKPDVQGPTSTIAASSTNNTATWTYGGTSGSTPYVAGAAGLIRGQKQSYGFSTLPGHIYATLINDGQNLGNSASDNNNGTGLLNVVAPFNVGVEFSGKTTISHNQTVDIFVGSSGIISRNMDCAIWWPESRSTHNDIDLRLIAPNGTTIDTSNSTNSVFEKVNSRNTPYTGSVQMRIYGYNVSGSQDVYYTCKRGS